MKAECYSLYQLFPLVLTLRLENTSAHNFRKDLSSVYVSCKCMCMWDGACGLCVCAHKKILVVFFYHYLPNSLRQVFPPSWGLDFLMLEAGKPWGSSCLHAPQRWLSGHAQMLGLLSKRWDLNSGPRDFKTSHLFSSSLLLLLFICAQTFESLLVVLEQGHQMTQG